MKKDILVLIITLSSLVNKAQNVGIGNAAPLEKLHVTGNIKADTIKPNALKLTPNAGNGKILTSDANGNASWQALSSSESGGGTGLGSWGDCIPYHFIVTKHKSREYSFPASS